MPLAVQPAEHSSSGRAHPSWHIAHLGPGMQAGADAPALTVLAVLRIRPARQPGPRRPCWPCPWAAATLWAAAAPALQVGLQTGKVRVNRNKGVHGVQ